MRRFSLWLRGKPTVADSMLAAVLVMLEVLVFASSEGTPPRVQLIMGLLLCLPVVWRRTYPRTVAVVILVASITSTTISYAIGLDDLDPEHPGFFALAVALYTLVAYVGRRAAALYVVGLVVDSVLAIWLLRQGVAANAVFALLVFALSWVTAEFLGARRAYDEEVAARLAVAEYDRDRRAAEAVAAERTRIARELHDVVAHAVSVMIVQADGASYAVKTKPDVAMKALANIGSTGREALAELRRTVSLLRTEPATDDMPQHGTAGLARVADMMRRAGLPVEMELTGELDDISPAISLGVHRLVQESLTNVLRHAGERPRAKVRVLRRDADVLVEVTDNGNASGQFPHGSGNGLLGMRERVAVLHGTLEAGRQTDGSWRVGAELPLEPRE
ncbi:histidine kinase [Rhodococcus sp. WMMA185]|uniref:sensor histidine kinase n=1 Tax=Rhodococcus sp. WMMA185 TaxID=679318 RepID=UPI000877F351|nr:histidine kinase [Rhodococcus sp. WMMA185]AOW92670.1 histidine kinase [Rhodococcus sp. WMMA185]